MIHRPYIAYMRDAAGAFFRVAWAPAQGKKFLPFPSAFGSNRYQPDGEVSHVEVGEQWTDEFVESPYDAIPSRVCGNCYIGEQSWFLGEWPEDAEPATLADDGWAEDCNGGCMGCTKSVNAVADLYTVTGGGSAPNLTLSFDLLTVPAGYALQGPASGPDAKPSFRPLSIPSITLVEGDNVDINESPAGTYTISVPTYPAADITGTLPAAQVGPGYDLADTSGLLDPAQLDSGTIPSGVDMPADQLTAATLPSGVLLPVAQLDGPGTIDPSLLPAPSIPSDYAGWVTLTNLYTDWSGIAPQTRTLLTLSAKQVISQIITRQTTGWAGSFGAPTLSFGYSGGQGSVPTDATHYGSLAPSGSSEDFYRSQFNSPSCRDAVGSWDFTIQIGSYPVNLTGLTAGRIDVSVLVAVLP